MQTQGSQERQKIGKGNPKMYISKIRNWVKLKTIMEKPQKLRKLNIFEILLDM